MRAKYLVLCGPVLIVLFSIMARGEDSYSTARSAKNASAAAPDPLLQLLVNKGVLNADEARSLTGTSAGQRARLLELLRQKGILSAEDYESLIIPPASAQVAPNLVASTTPILPPAAAGPTPEPQAVKAEAPKVIPAVAPLRVLQLEPAKPGGLIPDLKLGSGARLKLCGMVKASVIYDTSSPYGTDMPLPGFIPGPPEALSFTPRRDSHASAQTSSGLTSRQQHGHYRQAGV